MNGLENKTTALFLWSTSWIYLEYYPSDINLFLIDYVCCKLWNIWLLPLENNSRVITMQEVCTGGKALWPLSLKIEWLMAIRKSKLKTELGILVDYSYLHEFFNILAIGQKYLSTYPPFFFNTHRLTIFRNFVR